MLSPSIPVYSAMGLDLISSILSFSYSILSRAAMQIKIQPIHLICLKTIYISINPYLLYLMIHNDLLGLNQGSKERCTQAMPSKQKEFLQLYLNSELLPTYLNMKTEYQ